jgi:YD repeat-containing protein
VPANGVTYHYTPNNLMERAEVSGTTTRFTYDADDWRTKKAVDGGATTYYVRGPNGQLLAERTVNGSQVTGRDYVYAGSRLIAAMASDSVPPVTEPEEDPPPASSPTLQPGESLLVGEFRRSTDGRFTLVYQGDGNLVLLDGSLPVWDTGTQGTPPGEVAMQGDGNLVMYDAAQQVVCASDTVGNDGARLEVQNDGNVVLYSPAGIALRDRLLGQPPLCAVP